MTEGEPPRTRPTRIRNKHKHLGRKGEVRKRAEVLLADGEWHQFEKIVRQLIKLVPPGMAARRAEVMRKHASGEHGPAKRVRPRELDLQIRTGARAIVKDVLRDKRWFEIVPAGQIENPNARQVRMILPKEEPLTHEDFTTRQMQVLHLAAEGVTPLEISKRLGMRAESAKVNGARGILVAILRKFEVTSTAAAVKAARDAGILPPAPPLEGVDKLFVEALGKYKTDSAPYYADKFDVPPNVIEEARRRVYGRYGVDKMVDLRKKLEEQPPDREQMRATAVELYATSTGVREVAAQMGLGYGTVYVLLKEAGALRVRAVDPDT